MRGRGSGGAVLGLGQAGFRQGNHDAKQDDDGFHAGKFNREGATAQRFLGAARILVADGTRMNTDQKNLQKQTKRTMGAVIPNEWGVNSFTGVKISDALILGIDWWFCSPSTRPSPIRTSSKGNEINQDMNETPQSMKQKNPFPRKQMNQNCVFWFTS
jgi:hypothetical protein